MSDMIALSEGNWRHIREHLEDMEYPVKLVHFTQEFECESCLPAGQLLEELVHASDKLSLEMFDFQLDKGRVTRHGIDKVPATVVEGAPRGNLPVSGFDHIRPNLERRGMRCRGSR